MARGVLAAMDTGLEATVQLAKAFDIAETEVVPVSILMGALHDYATDFDDLTALVDGAKALYDFGVARNVSIPDLVARVGTVQADYPKRITARYQRHRNLLLQYPWSIRRCKMLRKAKDTYEMMTITDWDAGSLVGAIRHIY